MLRIAPIVEGHGEVKAVPVLLRRIAERVAPSRAVDVLRPIRVRRQRFLRAGELERSVDLAGRRAGGSGGILILMDADGDCPAEFAPELLRRAGEARPDRTVRAVLAKMEYEAWFLAAVESLAGKRGIVESVRPPREPESIRGAKERLSALMTPGRSYSETLDQPALTAIFDLDAARAAPSFDKLWRDVVFLLTESGGSARCPD